MRVENTRQVVLETLKNAKEPMTKDSLMSISGAGIEGIRAALWRLRADGHQIKCKHHKGIGNAYTYHGRTAKREAAPREDDAQRILDYIKKAKTPPTSAQIRDKLNIAHQRTQNMLRRFRDRNQIENVSKTQEAMWAIPAPKVARVREDRICAGTTTGTLNLSNYWTSPYRPGVEQTNAIKSRGF